MSQKRNIFHNNLISERTDGIGARIGRLPNPSGVMTAANTEKVAGKRGTRLLVHRIEMDVVVSDTTTADQILRCYATDGTNFFDIITPLVAPAAGTSDRSWSVMKDNLNILLPDGYGLGYFVTGQTVNGGTISVQYEEKASSRSRQTHETEDNIVRRAVILDGTTQSLITAQSNKHFIITELGWSGLSLGAGGLVTLRQTDGGSPADTHTIMQWHGDATALENHQWRHCDSMWVPINKGYSLELTSNNFSGGSPSVNQGAVFVGGIFLNRATSDDYNVAV